MNMLVCSNSLIRLIVRPFSLIFCLFYLVIFAIAKICDLIFYSSNISIEPLGIACLNSLIIYITLVSVLAFSCVSNHIIITLDILFFFSVLLLILFHILKDPRNLSAEESI